MTLYKYINMIKYILKISTIITLCVALFTVSGCANQDECIKTGGGYCEQFSFLDGVSITSKNSDFYVIKGVVLGTYRRNGLTVRLVEDLKGNFPKGVITFNVWKNINICYPDGRHDCLSCYDYQDVLIMLLTPEIPRGYTTLQCIRSVLKLSNGYVTGNILTWDEILEGWGLGNMTKEEAISYIESLTDEERKLYAIRNTLSWNELQKRLNNILKPIK